MLFPSGLQAKAPALFSSICIETFGFDKSYDGMMKKDGLPVVRVIF